MVIQNIPNAAGAIVPSGDAQKSWDDGYSEQPYSGGGKNGNQWEDWGNVMQKAISPALTALEDVLKRTPLDDDLDKAEIAHLWPLMLEQVNCPAAKYNLELRLLNIEMRAVSAVLAQTTEFSNDDLLVLDPSDYTEFGGAFYRIPPTRLECSQRIDAVRDRLRILHKLIEWAKEGGVFYDVCDLLDWFATRPEHRTTDSPSHALPFFGQQIFAVLGVAAQNTEWAHIEAVTSRQIAPRFGGDYVENEKTRFRAPLGDGGGPSNGVASNAPR